MAPHFHTVVIPVRPQPDTLAAIFLLKQFGREKYPGIEEARVEINNSIGNEPTSVLHARGILPLDVGGGGLDHHAAQSKTTASQLVADDLGIADLPSIQKLLQYAERDDKYGKGTISTDPLDRLFGFSGLVAAVNKHNPHDPQKTAEMFLPLIHAHYMEERVRTEGLPQEFEEKKRKGAVDEFTVKNGDKKLKVVVLTSENPSFAGWLRSGDGPKADVVAQYLPSGHLNILTRSVKRIDLRPLTVLIRTRESDLRKRRLDADMHYLARTGKIPEVPEWYYDRATNSIQNGGVTPGEVSPTLISRAELPTIIELGFGSALFRSERPLVPRVPLESNGPKKYFLEARIPQDAGEKIAALISSSTPGVKLHHFQNYHITLMYFGEREADEANALVEAMRGSLESAPPFSLVLNVQHFKTGEVTGYEGTRAFYFEIPNEGGGAELLSIRKKLEGGVNDYQKQNFKPHLTVASVKNDVMADVARDAAVEVRPDGEVVVPIRKLRLTEVYKDERGMTHYGARSYFALG